MRLRCCYTNITFSVQFVALATIAPSKPLPSSVVVSTFVVHNMSNPVINRNILPIGKIIKMPDNSPTPQAQIWFYQDFFTDDNANRIYNELLTNIKWRQDKIKLYGKEFLQPRLTAWYGEEGVKYTYSGITMYPEAWTDTLLRIKQQIEAAINRKIDSQDSQQDAIAQSPITQSPIEFNSVLINRYRHGQDSMGWHSDDEPELGENPLIASISFGQTRRFLLRHRHDKTLPKLEIPLNHGSLLIMAGQTQHYWQHHIPKTAKSVGERVNLTFRKIRE